MAASAQTLLWSLVLLFFVMYMFAIWLTQGVSNFALALSEADQDKYSTDLEILDEYFGSLMRSVYTLYRAITAGVAWGDAAGPLLEYTPFYMGVLLVFISMSIF